MENLKMIESVFFYVILGLAIMIPIGVLIYNNQKIKIKNDN